MTNDFTKKIHEHRRSINQVDQQIVGLLNKRVRVASEIGKLKLKSSKSIIDPEREKVVMENVARANKGPCRHESLVSIFELIMNQSSNYQKQVQKEEKRVIRDVRKAHPKNPWYMFLFPGVKKIK